MPKPEQRTLLQREKTRLPALLLPLTPRTLTPAMERERLGGTARPDQRSCSLYRKFSYMLRALQFSHGARPHSGLSSVLCVPQREVSAVRPRRHLQSPMPRDMAPQGQAGPRPALRSSQTEHSDSFTSATNSHSNFKSHHPVPSSSKNVPKLCMTLEETLVLGGVPLCHMALKSSGLKQGI